MNLWVFLIGLGVGIGYLFVAAPLMIWRKVSEMVIVGLGFVVGGSVFAAVFFSIQLNYTRETAGWLKATATIAKESNRDGNDSNECEDLQVRFETKVGTLKEAWLRTQSINTVWDAIDSKPDKDGRKAFVGAKLAVLYDPRDPTHAELEAVATTNYWVASVVSAGTFIPLGIGLLYGPCRNFLRRRRLATAGVRFAVEVIGIDKNKRLARRAHADDPPFHPWIVTAAWVHPKTGVEHELESTTIWHDPHAKVHVGGSIDAIIEFVHRPCLYAIDTESLGERWTVKLLRPS